MALLTYRDRCQLRNQKVKLIIESHGFRYWREVLSGTYPSSHIANPTLPLSLKASILNKMGRKTYTQTENDHYRAIDTLVVLTEEDSLNYAGYVQVIPNPLTLRPLTHSEQERSLYNRQKIVISAGRYGKQKDFEALLRIWRSISLQHSEWSLLIFGHQVPEKLNHLALGLERVYLYPATNNIRQEYLKSSIYAMTSKAEGLPLVLLEAQALGLPIVSFSCPCGPKDIITDGKDGYLIPPGDEALFAKQLSFLMANDELRDKMSREAFNSSKRFEVDHVMTQWLKLFQELYTQ